MSNTAPITAPDLGHHLVTIRHPQMRHPVQDRTPHQQLCRLPRETPRTDSAPEDRLQAKHLCLRQASAMIPTLALPRRPPLLATRSHILITLYTLLATLAVLPDPGIL